MTKLCKKCGIIKPLDQFYKQAIKPDGHKCTCKTCCDVKSKEYRDNNPDFYIKLYKIRYEQNKDKNKARQKQQYSEIKNDINYRNRRKSYMKLYRKEHPEMIRKHTRKRRALKINVNEYYTKEDEQYTLNLFNNKCANCGSTVKLTIDHHLPLSTGNALSRQNAVILCLYCNGCKKNKDPKDFYTEEKLDEINKLLGK